jgi:hypothetical protein
MILNITSYPRSGNSFFATTLLAFESTWKHAGEPVKFQPVGSLYSDELIKFGPPGIHKCPYNNRASADRNPTARVQDPDYVYVYKRHDHPDDYIGPRIYIVRDGRDVLVSYAHHNLVHGRVMTNIKAGRDAGHGGVMEYSEEELHNEMRRLAQHSGWGSYVKAGVHHPDVVAVVRYEDLLTNPIHHARLALSAAGLEVTATRGNKAPSFGELKKGQPWFYRKGKTGAHKEELPPDVLDTFMSIPGNKEGLELLGYE